MADEFGDDRFVTDQVMTYDSTMDDEQPYVDNPLKLLESAAYVQRTDPSTGDEELAKVLDEARAQLLIRPSDRVCWAIIRLLLIDMTEEGINRAADKYRQRARAGRD